MTNSRKASSPKAWRKRTGGEPLDLPSGNVALVKRPGMEKLLRLGLMPDSLTPIAMEHIQKAESGGRPTKKQQEKADADLNRRLMEQVLTDPRQLDDLMLSFDKVLVEVVVEPKVRMGIMTEKDEANGYLSKFNEKHGLTDTVDALKVGDEIPDDLRDWGAGEGEDPNDEDFEPKFLYADEVDMDDKQFIFQYVVGGTSDLASFRAQQAAGVAPA